MSSARPLAAKCSEMRLGTFASVEPVPTEAKARASAVKGKGAQTYVSVQTIVEYGSFDHRGAWAARFATTLPWPLR